MSNKEYEKSYLRDCCPVCGERDKNNIPYIERDFSYCDEIVPFRRYSVYCCVKCGMVYAGDLSESIPLDYYYENFSRYEGDNYKKNDVVSIQNKAIADMFVKHLNVNAKVLDVGCAHGALLSELKNKSFTNLYGIEPSVKNVNYARDILGLNVIQGELADSIEKLNDKFDVVILAGVLEHLVDVKKCIEILKALLNDKGRILFHIPDLDLFSNHADLYQEFSCEHINYFNIDSLDYLMKMNGFRNEDFNRIYTDPMGLSGNIISMYVNDNLTTTKYIENDIKLNRIRRSLQDYLDTSKMFEKRVMEKLKSINLENGYYIWGVGTNSAMMIQRGIINIKEIRGVFDSNKNYIGKTVYGKLIKDPINLSQMVDLPIIICSQYASNAIKKEIERMNLKNYVVDALDF